MPPPSRFAASWPNSAPDRSARSAGADPDRELLDPVDEIAPDPGDVTGQLDPLQPGDQLLEHQPDLHPGQAVAQAGVRTGTAEREVIVGRAGDVQVVRVLEDLLVPVA